MSEQVSAELVPGGAIKIQRFRFIVVAKPGPEGAEPLQRLKSGRITTKITDQPVEQGQIMGVGILSGTPRLSRQTGRHQAWT
ncbi:MAG: hypothetical protein WAM11_07430 [Cyanobium sp.]